MLKLTAFMLKDSATAVDEIVVDSIDEVHCDPDLYCRIDCTVNKSPAHFIAKRFIINELMVKDKSEAYDDWVRAFKEEAKEQQRHNK